MPKRVYCLSKEENAELHIKATIIYRVPNLGAPKCMPFSDTGLANAQIKPKIVRPNETAQKSPLKKPNSCTLRDAATTSSDSCESFSPPVKMNRHAQLPILSSSCASEPISATPTSSWQLSPSIPNQQHHVFVEFEKEILTSLRAHERKHRLSADFMKTQTEVTPKIRTGIINSLVEITGNYDMQTETLHLAVSYVDRVLSILPIKCPDLLAVAALMIPAKYEEVHVPTVESFVAMGDYMYNKTRVLHAELIILNTLNFDMATTTSCAFLNLYATKLNLPDVIKFLAMFLCDLLLLITKPLLPSVTAAAAIALARYNFKQTIWTKELLEATRYGLKDLKDAILLLTTVHCMSPRMEEQHVQLKYLNGKYMQVGILKPVELK